MKLIGFLGGLIWPFCVLLKSCFQGQWRGNVHTSITYGLNASYIWFISKERHMVIRCLPILWSLAWLCRIFIKNVRYIFIAIHFKHTWTKTLKSEQKGWHFEDDILKSIFLKEDFCIMIQILLLYVWGSNSALVEVMAWYHNLTAVTCGSLNKSQFF